MVKLAFFLHCRTIRGFSEKICCFPKYFPNEEKNFWQTRHVCILRVQGDALKNFEMAHFEEKRKSRNILIEVLSDCLQHLCETSTYFFQPFCENASYEPRGLFLWSYFVKFAVLRLFCDFCHINFPIFQNRSLGSEKKLLRSFLRISSSIQDFKFRGEIFKTFAKNTSGFCGNLF